MLLPLFYYIDIFISLRSGYLRNKKKTLYPNDKGIFSSDKKSVHNIDIVLN